MLCPDDAMNRFGGRVANCASRICLLGRFWSTFIALRQSTLNEFNLPIISGRSTFNQWNISSQAHSIDMVSSDTVVQSVENDLESLEEADTIVGTVIEEFRHILKSMYGKNKTLTS